MSIFLFSFSKKSSISPYVLTIFFLVCFLLRILDNPIYLTGQPGDVLSSDLSLAERIIIMSTYEELQIIISVALLIVAILTYTYKK